MQIFAENPEVDVPVICDPIEPRMQQALKALAALPRPQQPECVIDYRRVLDRKDVDAVVIASTQHWHGIPHIHACQAGKHIYVEKPLSHTVVEGRAMVTAAKKHRVIALMGTQQRCGEHYRKAVEDHPVGPVGQDRAGGILELFRQPEACRSATGLRPAAGLSLGPLARTRAVRALQSGAARTRLVV
jgi:hypothetical protein